MKALWRAIVARKLWQAILAVSVILGLVASGVAIFQFVSTYRALPSMTATWQGTLQGFSNDNFVLHLTEKSGTITGIGTDDYKLIIECPASTAPHPNCIPRPETRTGQMQILYGSINNDLVGLFATSKVAADASFCELYFRLKTDAERTLMAGTLTSGCNQYADVDIILRRAPDVNTVNSR